MTGGPWHISDDPDDPWAISEQEYWEAENPLVYTELEFLALAVSKGFPDDDARYRRLVATFEGAETDEEFAWEIEEHEDADHDDLMNFMTGKVDPGYSWSWDADRGGILRLPSGYAADGGS